MHGCTYVRTHARTHVRMYVCTYVFMYYYVYARMVLDRCSGAPRRGARGALAWWPSRRNARVRSAHFCSLMVTGSDRSPY